MCVEFKKRHDYVVAELNSIDGVECLETDGTFYVFPNVEKLIARLDGINNDLEFSDYLIEKAGRCVGTRFCIWFRRTYQDFDCHQHG